ncbi:MAG TPA: hypothetical protein VJN88_10910 [Ktedonobacterales bacterium]|nr:hypothetical protein [Ktedonobacterales bacterium]
MALLCVAGVGVATATYVHGQLRQPERAATAFCADLTAQRYADAYALFSANLRRQITSTQFLQAAQTLDTLEGSLSACHYSHYQYSLGSNGASAALTLTRTKQGILAGPLRLVHERDGWKVDTLDNGLLGVDLGALNAAQSYCAALQAQDYAAAYKSLGDPLQKTTSQAVYVADAQAHAQVDGAIQSCALTALGHGATASSASFTISMARAKLGARSGTLALTATQGVWRVTKVDASLSGSDLGALSAGAAFCGDLTNGDYNGAYGLLSPGAQSTYSTAQFQQQFAVTSILRWNGCAPDLSTYQASGDKASYNAALKVTRTDTGASTSLVFALNFVRSGNAWKLDSWMLVTVR